MTSENIRNLKNTHLRNGICFIYLIGIYVDSEPFDWTIFVFVQEGRLYFRKKYEMNLNNNKPKPLFLQ